MRVAPVGLYSDIFTWPPPETESREVIIGTIFGEPNLALSYLLAARYALEQGETNDALRDIVMPASYLHRHAWEVQLKLLIEFRLATNANRDWWDQQKDGEPSREKTTARTTHDLNRLLNDLQGLRTVPDEVVNMTAKLVATEGDQPTAFRYLRQVDGRRSFEEFVTLDPIGIQYDLEVLFQLCLRVDFRAPTAARPGTWASAIAREWVSSEKLVRSVLNARHKIPTG